MLTTGTTVLNPYPGEKEEGREKESIKNVKRDCHWNFIRSRPLAIHNGTPDPK